MILFRLIRFPNLLVVALTQWLVAERVLGVAYARRGIPGVLSTEELWWLILATVSVTAAGYVINDLLDHTIDLINRPERVIVGERMTVGTVAWVAGCFFFAGFGFSLLLALKKQELEWLWLYPLFGLLLGLYPRHLKTKPFLGNLFIASCCAGAAGLVWLAERAAWRQLDPVLAAKTSYILLLFMGYAFLATSIREIIKDYEDYTGDAAFGRVTVPVYLGRRAGKRLVVGLTLLLVLSLLSGFFAWSYLPVQPWVMAVSSGLLVVAVYATRQLGRAVAAEDYRYLSRLWKLFMLGGLLLLYLYQI